SFVYILKGYYGDFFKYDIENNSWHELTRYDYKIFMSREGKKKKPKDGAGLVYYNNNVYMLKGGNTYEFWKYDIATDNWVQMAEDWDIPIGGGKRVKGGGALTMFNNYFYASKGSNTDEFYRHSLPTIATTLTPPPLATDEGITGNTITTNQFELTIAPNPAINATAVKYNLPKPGRVSLRLYDISGKLINAYGNSNLSKNGIIMIDMESMPSGVYILRFDSGKITVTRKLVLKN
ncbi:MAG: T9SS type A sorting domain-containing protein, partial [candidate division WOR-3 bacterium]|nr:T9SS type A sorting domain-containing protein [candidate division WOR-3 bacterium]